MKQLSHLNHATRKLFSTHNPRAQRQASAFSRLLEKVQERFLSVRDTVTATARRIGNKLSFEWQVASIGATLEVAAARKMAEENPKAYACAALGLAGLTVQLVGAAVGAFISQSPALMSQTQDSVNAAPKFHTGWVFPEGVAKAAEAAARFVLPTLAHGQTYEAFSLTRNPGVFVNPVCSTDSFLVQQKPKLLLPEELVLRPSIEPQNIPEPLSGPYIASFCDGDIRNALETGVMTVEELLSMFETNISEIYYANRDHLNPPQEAVWAIFGNPADPGWHTSEGLPPLFDRSLFDHSSPNCVLRLGVFLDDIVSDLATGSITLEQLLFEQRDRYFQTSPGTYGEAFLASFVLELRNLLTEPNLVSTTTSQFSVGVTWRSARAAQRLNEHYGRSGSLPPWTPAIYEVTVTEVLRDNVTKGVLSERAYSIIDAESLGTEIPGSSRSYQVKGSQITAETQVSVKLLSGPALIEFVTGVGSLKQQLVEVTDERGLTHSFSSTQGISRNFRWQGLTLTAISPPKIIISPLKFYLLNLGLQSKTGGGLLNTGEPMLFFTAGVSTGLRGRSASHIFAFHYSPLFFSQGNPEVGNNWHVVHNFTGIYAYVNPRIFLSTTSLAVGFSHMPIPVQESGSNYNSRLMPGDMLNLGANFIFDTGKSLWLPKQLSLGVGTSIPRKGYPLDSGKRFYDVNANILFEL